MGLIVLITVALLGCIFMLFVLIRWIQDAKGKPKTRKTDSERPRMQPFLVKRENSNRMPDIATIRRTETDRPRLSKQLAAPSGVSNSEMFVRQRIVQIFAARMVSRREG